ncbi:MAG: hypothetical protein K2R98_19845 [Gemmataceae bacterium]|nr:hypothetical protein [Gemmataceae bacterium]
MTQIIVDAALCGQLQKLDLSVDLCDQSGQVLGRFTPALVPAKYDLEPKISREEIERRKKSDKWYTTAEVLAHLEKLP